MTHMASPASNLYEYSVGELSQAIQKTVEGAFGRVRLRGEVSGFMRARSGHLYMDIKDNQAVLNAVCWKSQASRLSVQPVDGLEVIATGRITTYGPRSRYQIIIESIEVAGEGALLKMIEDRRRRLEREGLFAADRKQPLPYLPTVIGVVTSPTGAVFHDILHRLKDRFPREVILWPVAVQGDAAAAAIAAAIRGFDALPPGGVTPRPNVLIVGRGGGSVEDLMAFNEEDVVRAVSDCTIPIISAIGHETDVSLTDHAADERAPTPTAAAERVVPVRAELQARVLELGKRLVEDGYRLVESRRVRLELAAGKLTHPSRQLEFMVQRLDDLWDRVVAAARTRIEKVAATLAGAGARLRTPAQVVDMARSRFGNLWESIGRGINSRKERARHQIESAGDVERMKRAMERRIVAATAKVASLGEILEAKNPAAIRDRGFVLVRKVSGVIAKSTKDVTTGEHVFLGFHDGDLAAEILSDK